MFEDQIKQYFSQNLLFYWKLKLNCIFKVIYSNVYIYRE